MGLGLLYGSIIKSFSGEGLLALRPNTNLEDQEMIFVWPLSFDLIQVALPKAYTPANIALRVSGARKTPLPDKAAVLERSLS
jgi:hypothetical protein